jgi:hypothetical protein
MSACPLPPATMTTVYHRMCKVTDRFQPTFAAFIQHNKKFYEGPNMTADEFKAFDVRNLPASSDSE